MSLTSSTVSIVVPVYNVETWLDDCLLSVRAQTHQDIEIIVVNDGSTDFSLEVARAHARKDGRIRILDQENRGLGGARNTGIGHAAGDYLVFVDSDDFIAENFIEVLLAKQRETRADVISCHHARISEKSKFIAYRGAVISAKATAFGLTDYEQILGMYSSSVVWGRLFKASMIAENGIRFPEHMPHEDLFYTYKILKDVRHAEISDALYFWRRRKGSLSTSVGRSHLKVPWHLREDTTAFLESRNASRREHALAASRNLKFLESILHRAVAHKKRLLATLLSEIEAHREAIDRDIHTVRNELAEYHGLHARMLRSLDQHLAEAFDRGGA